MIYLYEAYGLKTLCYVAVDLDLKQLEATMKRSAEMLSSLDYPLWGLVFRESDLQIKLCQIYRPAPRGSVYTCSSGQVVALEPVVDISGLVSFLFTYDNDGFYDLCMQTAPDHSTPFSAFLASTVVYNACTVNPVLIFKSHDRPIFHSMQEALCFLNQGANPRLDPAREKR